MCFMFVGGKLVYLHQKKLGTIPKCGDCKVKLHGVSDLLNSSSLDVWTAWLQSPVIKYDAHRK